MNKDLITKILNDVLIPLNFKKKGNKWLFEGEEIWKIITVQTSKFSSKHYLNYGFIIKNLPLNKRKAHLYKRFKSNEYEQNKRIYNLLQTDNILSEDDKRELKSLINKFMKPDLMKINTKEDVFIYLQG